MDSACDTRQNETGAIPSRTGLLTAAFSGFSLQGFRIDLQSTVTLLLNGIDKRESNIGNVIKTNNLFHERITAQEHDKVSLHPDSSEYQGS